MGRIGLAASTELSQVLRLIGLADRFQMDDVGSGLEDAAIRRLGVSACADVMVTTGGAEPGPICSGGLPRLRAAAYAMAAQRFEEVASTEGFTRLSEDDLDALLQDQTIKAGRAEVIEAIVPWMRAALSQGGGCGEGGGGGGGGGEGGGFPGRKLLARVHHRTYGSMHQPAVTECLAHLRALKASDGEEQPAAAARARTWGTRLRRAGIRPNGSVGRFVAQLFRF
jgi:hypothetical protein